MTIYGHNETDPLKLLLVHEVVAMVTLGEVSQHAYAPSVGRLSLIQ